jgi:hypothetical protein
VHSQQQRAGRGSWPTSRGRFPRDGSDRWPCARVLKFNCSLGQIDQNAQSAWTAKRSRNDRRAPPPRQTSILTPRKSRTCRIASNSTDAQAGKFTLSGAFAQAIDAKAVVIGLRKSWIGIGNRVQWKGRCRPTPAEPTISSSIFRKLAILRPSRPCRPTDPRVLTHGACAEIHHLVKRGPNGSGTDP